MYIIYQDYLIVNNLKGVFMVQNNMEKNFKVKILFLAVD